MRTGRILLLALALALTVGTTASGAGERTYFRAPFSGKAQFKPKRISFSDSDLTQLRWRSWNRRHAFGRGRARVNNCIPFCAAGKILHGPVKLTMYHRYKSGHRWFYRCVKGVARVPGPDQRILWCPPKS
jgi:hypothetical protein